MPGPFYFAWVVDSTVAFNPAVHNVDLQNIFAADIQHTEGDFATLTLDIINPRVGLLAPGRNVWGWFSWFNGTTIVPLFFGRLVGVPESLQNEAIRIVLIARPENFVAQKAAVAESLKVRPYFDPIWFTADKLNDPDIVLESRCALWHVNRTSLAVTASDAINGEDGLLDFDTSDVFYDSVDMRIGETPLRRVDVTATVQWQQNAKGIVDISKLLGYAPGPFDSRDIAGKGAAGFNQILSYTGSGLMSDWPKVGDNIGAGWSVAEATPKRLDGTATAEFGYDLSGFSSGDAAKVSMSDQALLIAQFTQRMEWPIKIIIEIGQVFMFTVFPSKTLYVPRWRIQPSLKVQYDASRQKSEIVTFSLVADVQSTVSDASGTDIIALQFNSSELETVQDSGHTAIIDPAYPVYFAGPNGDKSLEYLLCVARARLLIKARAVTVKFEIPWGLAISSAISCRKNARITDARLPGGSATGKIVAYGLSIDGSTGAQKASITIGCTVGKGNAVTAADGTPTYVDDGYVSDYQRRTGEHIMPIDGELWYESLSGLPAVDDGIDFFRMTPQRVVQSVVKTNSWKDQAAATAGMGQSVRDGWSNLYDPRTGLVYNEPPRVVINPDVSTSKVFDKINSKPTTIQVTLLPIGKGPYQTSFTPNISNLMVPKLIDLEAS